MFFKGKVRQFSGLSIDESPSNLEQIYFYWNEKGHVEPEIQGCKHVILPGLQNTPGPAT